jgi:hypothetical protein
MAAQQKKQIDPNLLLIAGAGVFGYFFIIDPLLKWAGLKDDKEDKENEAALNNLFNQAAWSPNFYRTNQPAGILYITPSSADKIAKLIEDAWSIWGDDEEQVYGALRSIPDQVALSQVSASYLKLFRTDLITDIKSRMSEAEELEVASIVNRLPAFRKAR